MSSETQVHLSSIAKRLEATGFKRTGIAKAVIELVQSYIGHANPGENITKALQSVNEGVTNVVPKYIPEIGSVGPIGNATNDSQIHNKRIGDVINEKFIYGKHQSVPANDSHIHDRNTGSAADERYIYEKNEIDASNDARIGKK